MPAAPDDVTHWSLSATTSRNCDSIRCASASHNGVVAPSSPSSTRRSSSATATRNSAQSSTISIGCRATCASAAGKRWRALSKPRAPPLRTVLPTRSRTASAGRPWMSHDVRWSRSARRRGRRGERASWRESTKHGARGGLPRRATAIHMPRAGVGDDTRDCDGLQPSEVMRTTRSFPHRPETRGSNASTSASSAWHRTACPAS